MTDPTLNFATAEIQSDAPESPDVSNADTSGDAAGGHGRAGRPPDPEGDPVIDLLTGICVGIAVAFAADNLVTVMRHRRRTR